MKTKRNRSIELHETINEYYGYTEDEWWKLPETTRRHLATYRKGPVRYGQLWGDHDGILGTGTVYWVDNRTHISLIEILDLPEDELREMFYPRQLIESIKGQLK